MDYQKIAQQVLQLVGGKENVISLTHCFTRLRFQLRDNQKADRNKLLQTEGVISVVEGSGQYQVVLGNKVTKIYDAILPLIGKLEPSKQNTPKVSIGVKILNAFAAIFTPVIPAIAASGMLKGILAIAVMIGNYYYQTDIKPYDTYIILHAASDAVFYFMPIILGYTAAKVFKAHEFISMIIGATLCYPSIVNLMAGKSEVTFFAIELTKASYTSSVIPIILAVFILSYVQIVLEKIIPEVLKIIMVPTFSLLIMIPATLLIFGPTGIYIGKIINFLYYYIMHISPILLGAFIGGIWCILVIFGAHRAIVPIGINDVAQTGQQNLLAFAGAANFSQAGAALGVFFKTRNKNLKTVAASATITALFGITEPAIYGANLRLKRPMICAVICGAIGGGLMGWGGSYGTAFANQGILTIPVYAEAGTTAFLCYLIGCCIAFFGSCITTILVGFNDIPNEQSESSQSTIPSESHESEVSNELKKNNALFSNDTIDSPVKGRIIPLADVNDAVFASGAMGKGVAVYPKIGEIIAPANCTITALYPTMHAIGLKLDNGVELLIHIGIDTVKLQGKYFKSYVQVGQHITKGTKIVSFDIDKIEQQKFDLTTSVVVVDSEHYKNIESSKQFAVSYDDKLLMIEV